MKKLCEIKVEIEKSNYWWIFLQHHLLLLLKNRLKMEEVDVRQVIQPNKFFVTPIRRLNPSDEVANILKIEAGLPGFANDPDLEVTRANVDQLKENVIIAAKVNVFR